MLYFLFNIFPWCVNVMHLILLKTISTCTLLIHTYVKQHKYILHRYVASGLLLSSFSHSPIKHITFFCVLVHATNFMHCTSLWEHPCKPLQLNDLNIKQIFLFIACIIISHIQIIQHTCMSMSPLGPNFVTLALIPYVVYLSYLKAKSGWNFVPLLLYH